MSAIVGPETHLWHYTCDHGHSAIGQRGHLLPIRQHSPAAAARMPTKYQWMLDLIWLTDLNAPHRQALGLTLLDIRCDRTEHRYRVLAGRCIPWTDYSGVPRAAKRRLNAEPGGMPMHWWVADAPVAVEYDPLQVGAR